MFKRVLYKIWKSIVAWGISKLYNLIDKDKNGDLSSFELDWFISDVREKLTAIKRKI